MLNQYILGTQQLLQNPIPTNALYPVSNLTSWVNTARGQLAGEGECIRFMASIPLVAGQQVYPFSSISLAGSTGIQGILKIQTIWRDIGTGQVWLRPRPFPWFSLYELNNPNPVQGSPTLWTQYGQGASGSFYVSPVPDQAYTCNLDCVCYPISLASDADPEAIPYLWTDAVPFFAAWYALLAAQSAARQADADRMMARYKEFVARARQFTTPSIMPGIYSQSPDPVRAQVLGLTQGGSR